MAGIALTFDVKTFRQQADVSGLELTGAAVDTAMGIGIWRDLKKAA